MSPQHTQDLMPRNAALEDVFPKANLGIYQIFHLRNLNLMKDWEYTRVYERQRDVYMDIKKWRQLHVMLAILPKAMSNVSRTGKTPTSIFNICREV